MGLTPEASQISYLSTGVVARALGLDQAGVRAMINIGTLPAPQWMTVGSKVERVYSLEWLVLASQQLNIQRLSGLEFELVPRNTVQFALRFDRGTWTLDQLAAKLGALEELWRLCAATLSEENGAAGPELQVRRLSAGSPLDVLAWVGDNWQGIVGAGGLASVFIYILRHPDQIVNAIPRAVSAWRHPWAEADDAKVQQIVSRSRRLRFEEESARILQELDAVPSDTALSGEGTNQLEISPPDIAAISPEHRSEIEGDRSDGVSGTGTDI